MVSRAPLDLSGSESDEWIIRTVKDDLGAWQLRRLVWVADAGFASAANRAYLTRGGGHYIHAEKLRRTTPRPPPRWPAPAATTTRPNNLRSKRCGSHPVAALLMGRARSGPRCVTTRMPPPATPGCGSGSSHLQGLIDGSDLARPPPRRTGRLPEEQARAAKTVAPHQGRAVAHRPRRRPTGSPLRRQVAAAHLHRR